MHRDKKLGLGLGILLVGVVAAFFFRHEAPPVPTAELADPERLDRAIAEKDVSPYPDTLASRRSDSRGGPEGRLPGEDAWALPDFLREGGPPDATAGGSPPNPIATQPRPATLGGANAGPEHNQAWRSASPRTGASGSTGASRNLSPSHPAGAPLTHHSPLTTHSADAPVLHRVVQGDTLSGLAARYLGSSGRFLEIYEANRDVLGSPNDLRVGMTLRIPALRETPPVRQSSPPTVRVSDTEPSVTGRPTATGTVPVLPATDQRQSSESSTADSENRPEPRLRFQPVRRSPLAPRAPSRESFENDDSRTAAFPPGHVDLLPLEEMFGAEMPP